MASRLALTVLLVATGASAANAEDFVERPHVKVRLISKSATVVPGEEATVGLHLKLDEGWHVYWRNPGESGLPPSIEWNLPDGCEAGAIQWPAPKRIMMGPILNFGYEGEVVLPVAIKIPEDARGTITLKATASWLVCEETCIDGEADLGLTVPVVAGAKGDDSAGWTYSVAMREGVPLAGPADLRAYTANDGSVRLELGALGKAAIVVDFFPDESAPVTLARPLAVAGDGGVAAIAFERSDADGPLRGLLVVGSPRGREAYEIDAVIDADVTGPPERSGPAPLPPPTGGGAGVWTVIVALLVGLAIAMGVLWRSLGGTR